MWYQGHNDYTIIDYDIETNNDITHGNHYEEFR